MNAENNIKPTEQIQASANNAQRTADVNQATLDNTTSTINNKPSEPVHFKMGGKHPITFDRFIRGLIGASILAGVCLGIYYLSEVLIPFFIAWMVAYLLYPMVRFLQHKCHLHNRLLAIAITLLLVCGLCAGFFYLVVPPMIEEMGHLKNVALAYIQKGADNTTIPQPVQEFLHRHVNKYQIENLLQQKDVMAAIKSTVPKVWNVLWSTAGIIINIVASLIALLYLLFILTDYEKYANGWIQFVPKNKRTFAAQLVSDIEHGMAGYFRGQALVALSNCVMFSIGFLIIGFPMPIGLGCLIGVISFVPYLQVVGFVPASLLALLKAAETGENFWWLLCLIFIVYLVVQVLQDTIFTPRIMGKIMGLPPAIILLSLSVWGYALGIIGLILALPITTLAISYYKRYVVGDNSSTPANPTTDVLDDETIAVEKATGIYVEPPTTNRPFVSDDAKDKKSTDKAPSQDNNKA